MKKLLLISGLHLTLLAGGVHAHQIPVLVVEAEFDVQRNCTLRVNVDPRLILTPEPASMPPVPAAWYLDQKPADRAKTADQVRDYLARTLIFTVGAEPLKPTWEVTAIDSISNFPLTANSAETHLLASYSGPLPPVPGDFRLRLDPKCAVGLIMLTSMDGTASRQPGSVFPGETSHPFALPTPAPVRGQGAAGSEQRKPAGEPANSVAQKTGIGEKASTSDWARKSWEALPVALLLGLALGSRWRTALGGLLSFHITRAATLLAMTGGWLPGAPPWMAAAYWVLLAGVGLSLWLGRAVGGPFFASFAAAGFCEALKAPGSIVLACGMRAMAWQDGSFFLDQMVMTGLVAAVVLTVSRAVKAPNK